MAIGSTGRQQRFETLDALRGICALLVCLFHFRAAGFLTHNPLVRSSWLFVDFFFVLSGFVLAHSYLPALRQGLAAGNFVGVRFMRLYPLHLVMLLLFVFVELAGSLFLGQFMQRPPFTGTTSPTALFLNLLMLHSFGLYGQLSWNHPSWSIAVEFWTYILFAVLVVRTGRWLNAVSALLVALSLLFLLRFNALGVNTTWEFGFVRCVFGFFIGVLGYALWQRRGCPTDALPPLARTPAEIACVLATGLAVILLSAGRMSLVLPPIFLGTILMLSGRGGVVSGLLRQRPMLLLGKWSYGIYMVHVFVQSRVDDMFRVLARIGGPDVFRKDAATKLAFVGRTALEGNLITIGMLVLVVGFAALMYRCVEAPGIRWGKRLFLSGASRQADGSRPQPR